MMKQKSPFFLFSFVRSHLLFLQFKYDLKSYFFLLLFKYVFGRLLAVLIK